MSIDIDNILKGIEWKTPYSKSPADYEVMIRYTAPNGHQKHGRLTIRFNKERTPVSKYERIEISKLSKDSNTIVFKFMGNDTSKCTSGYALSITPNGKMAQPLLMSDELEAYNKIWRATDFYRLYHIQGPYYYIQAPEVK